MRLRLFVAAASLLLVGAEFLPEAPHQRSFVVMGKAVDLQIFDRGLSDTEAERILQGALGVMQRAEDKLFSLWPSSPIAQINESKPGEPVALDRLTFGLLKESLKFARLTDGAFDVTAAPLDELWDRAIENAEPPASDTIESALRRVGYQYILLDSEKQEVRVSGDGIRANLDALARRYAVDMAASYLRKQGIRSARLESGEDSRYVGAPPRGRHWFQVVDHPREIDGSAFVVQVPENAALSITGDYQRFFYRKGRRYHPFIDPRTGRQPEHRVVSVTVIARNLTLAHIVGRTFFVLGPRRGFEILKALDKSVKVFCITETTGGQLVLESSEGDRSWIKEVHL